MPSLQLEFVTFGMFIIDEIEYTDGRECEQDLIGGAGTYAALGARLAASSHLARSVSWIVDVGSDFPPRLVSLIDSWNTDCVYRHDSSRKTTRAWNGYGANESRAFKYLTSKIRLEVDSLNDQQASASTLHMVCSSSRCIELSTKLKQRRQKIRQRHSPTGQDFPLLMDPIIIWEPIPDLCTPAELASLRLAANHVSVISPNADELAQVFDSKSDTAMPQSQMVSELVGSSSPSGQFSVPHVIVREGAKGSTIYFSSRADRTKSHDSQSKMHALSISAYHNRSMASRVIDPTGGGNTYLGALAMALSPSWAASHYQQLIEAAFSIQDDDPRRQNVDTDKTPPYTLSRLVSAAIIATIAASYAIEQCGVPSLTSVSDPRETTSEAKNADDRRAKQEYGRDRDVWNGEAFEDRLVSYLHREREAIQKQIAKWTLS